MSQPAAEYLFPGYEWLCFDFKQDDRFVPLREDVTLLLETIAIWRALSCCDGYSPERHCFRVRGTENQELGVRAGQRPNASVFPVSDLETKIILGAVADKSHHSSHAGLS